MALTERRKKEIASLGQKKYRYERGEFIIEGVRSVESALETAAPIHEIVVSEGRMDNPRLRALLKKTNRPVHTVSDSDFERLGEVETSQGVLAVAGIVLTAEADLVDCRRVLLLDGIQDPGNVGTILRTAAWFGIEAVVAGPGTADFFNPKVVRATMGGLWDVRLAMTDDLPGLLGTLSRAGLMICGADLEGEPVETWKPARRTALVLGSEAHGLSPEAAAVLNRRLLISGTPGRKGVESLNVATAAAILLHHWTTGVGRAGKY